MPQNYKNRLQIPIEGNSDTAFTTKSGLLVACGYSRIVIGQRGPYIEFSPDHVYDAAMKVPEDQKYRFNDARVYYLELRTIDTCNVKIYYQLKRVSYADYQVNFLYISPFDLLADGKIIIEPVKKG